MMDNADPAMGIILVSLLAVAFALVVSILSGGLLTKERPRKDCDRHDWSINPKTNKLECIRCGYEAGKHETDTGNY